ncbi:MAG: transcriptional regulator PpsR [Pseudomonadota bacterium]
MNKVNVFFANPDRFSHIDAHAISRMISTSSDVAFIVTKEGVIHDISIGTESFSPTDLDDWNGARLEDLVTVDSRGKIRELLEQASQGETPHWREVNHKTADGDEFPVRYSAVRTGPEGHIVLLGRDLRSVSNLQNRLVQAQLALEQDYARFRQIETRYRVLFETSNEALVIIDAESGRIVEANPEAARVLGRPARDLTNAVFESEFATNSHRDIVAALASVRATGQAVTVAVEGIDNQVTYDIHCVLFRAATETFVLCRMKLHQGAEVAGINIEQALDRLFHRSSDAIVLTDPTGVIQQCNEAFLSMADVAVAESLRGRSLSQFLGRPSVDLNVMISNASEHGRLSMYSTSLRSEYGTETPVEISTAHLSAPDREGFGFIIRDVSRLEASRVRSSSVSPESVEHVMELVGSAPLKELVRATTDVVEKMCIETALQLTGNNRASAAEMLGLSRQSLYVKLRKFGLISSSEAPDS